MKAKKLSENKLFVFYHKRDEATLYVATPKNKNYPDEVPAKQVIMIDTKSNILKLSTFTTSFKPDDTVHYFINSELQ